MKSMMSVLSALTLVFLTGSVSAQKTQDVWNDSLSNLMRKSAELNLPTAPLENKIREGRAKHKSSAQIYAAVKARQTHLLQIRSSNNGTIPDDCSKQLLTLEQKTGRTVDRTKKIVVRQKPVLPSPVDQQKTRKIQATPPPQGDSLSAQKSPIPSEATEKKHGNGNQQKLEKKLRKAETRAERKLTKAAEKAEKRMNQIEKKLRKKSKRKFGTD